MVGAARRSNCYLRQFFAGHQLSHKIHFHTTVNNQHSHYSWKPVKHPHEASLSNYYTTPARSSPVNNMTTDKPTLFDRLGGTEACRAVVNEFYQRLLDDETLAKFFDDITVPALKIHQLEFLKIAFTGIPEDMDVSAFMLEKHHRLFQDKGLNADHFDSVAGHLVATLQHLKVPADLMDEAAGVVLPLRPVFEKGAALYNPAAREENKQEDDPTTTAAAQTAKDPPLAHTTLLGKLGGAAAVRAAVEELYTRLLADPETAVFFEDINMAWLKQHQIDFMKIAFSQVPEDLNVPAYMKEKHASLFDKGLNANHFDAVATHFVGALKDLNVDPKLVDEAVAVIGPLRSVFEEGAKEADAKKAVTASA